MIYLDLMIGTIAVFNIRVLYLLPRFGQKIKGLQKNGADILKKNPWMRKATFAGVVAFVMFPLSGTGAIGGSLFGQAPRDDSLRTLLASPWQCPRVVRDGGASPLLSALRWSACSPAVFSDGAG